MYKSISERYTLIYKQNLDVNANVKLPEKRGFLDGLYDIVHSKINSLSGK